MPFINQFPVGTFRYKIVGMLVLLAILGLAGCTPAPASLPTATATPLPAPTSTATPVPSPLPSPTLADIPFLSVEHIRENQSDKGPKYVIEISYPVLDGAGDKGAAFNQRIKGIIDEQIATFKTDLKQVEAAQKDIPDYPTWESGLYADYKVLNTSKGVLSVRLELAPFMAGAAHPNHYSQVVTYDLKTGQLLSDLQALFVPGADYLKVISELCIAEIKQRGINEDANWVAQGAGPKAENYQNWNITDKGLLITFDPYQVAAYAAGKQEVLIPYAALKDVIEKNSGLAPFLP